MKWAVERGRRVRRMIVGIMMMRYSKIEMESLGSWFSSFRQDFWKAGRKGWVESCTPKSEIKCTVLFCGG